MQSTSLLSIHEGAKAFYGALFELLPYVEAFQNEVYNAKSPQSSPEEQPCANMKRLQAQLETLRSQVIQMKSEIAGIRKNLKILLNDSDAEIDTFISATAVMKFENTGGLIHCLWHNGYY